MKLSPVRGTPRIGLVAAILPALACAPSDADPSDDTPEAPAEEGPPARVLGEDVDVANAQEMQAVILQRLLDRYAAQRDIEAEESEVDALVADLAAATPEDATADLTEEEMGEVDAMRRSMATSVVSRWKIHRALYEDYGGRIIYQQMGPEPLDAYRQFLEDAEEAGDFEILREEWRDDFWRYFTDESMHTFYEAGSPDEAAAFTTPPWEMAGAGG